MSDATEPRPRREVLLEAALEYAKHGFRVFPTHVPMGRSGCSCGRDDCKSPGKHPRLKDGFKGASTDPEVIRGFWAKWPLANVAVEPAPDHFVVDIDEREGQDCSAALEFERKLPPTYTVKTGGGGRHYYYRNPTSRKVTNTTGSLPEHVDIRAHGYGYVLAPPSNHRSGGFYVADPGQPGIDEIADAPVWLVEQITGPMPKGVPNPKGAAPKKDGDNVTFVAGGRHKALVKRAGQLHSRGCSAGEILAALKVLNAERCSPPKPEDELEEIVAWVQKKNVDPHEAAAVDNAGMPEREAEPDDWESSLYYKEDGSLRPWFANAAIIIANDGAFRDLWLDEMTLAPMLGKDLFSDADLGNMRLHITKRYRVDFPQETMKTAMLNVAHQRKRHPVREYVLGLKWDGKPRFAELAERCFGVTKIRDVTLIRNAILSAVARAFEPGCKVDDVLVVIGKQNAGKSTFWKTLFSPWFADTAIDLHSKDAMMQIHAAWCYELAEADKLFRGYDAQTFKRFVSSSEDMFRPPYGTAVIKKKRSGIMVGTTNEDEFLTDPTGARRFKIILMPTGFIIDNEWVTANRDQIFAEAKVLYDAGTKHFLPRAEEDALSAESMEKHGVSDAWLEPIIQWLPRAPVDGFTSHQVLREAIGLEVPKYEKKHEQRVGDILRGIGYERKNARKGDKVIKVFVKKAEREPGEEG